ncbi:hypothetical protein [Streptomyces umbrinus]|uniref:hypothetical protein n=1 Tax=Streptomyces umbrinus TaxID=67370 RepID=UPI0027D7B392|nr:hypothetical protein [Streptomyces umbrinus]
MPIFLVNPSYEYALLRQVDGKEWRIATLDPFVSLGFARDFPSQSVPPVPALAAMIDGDRISVAVRHEGAVMHSWHNIPIAPEISTVVREWEHIMVAVTTLLDVRKPIPLDLLRTLIGARKVALGPARLTSVRFSEHAQALKPGDFAETPSAFRT